jgi:hypothetical protein
LTENVGALRVQVSRQVYHWQAAVVGLRDPENFAAAAAWAGLERYLDVALRPHLVGAADALARDVDVLVAELKAADSAERLEQLRRRILVFRRRYLQVETALDFYGHAISSRTTPRLAALLRACDALATRSMEEALTPLRRDVPPVLTYVDKGMGASILRAGLRLWDGAPLSPAAAVKVTRQNLLRPTALIHEAGHQVAHIIGWNEELAALLAHELGPPEVAAEWSSWASEIAADTFAFVNCGYGAVAALHDVVSGGPTVFRHLSGDPHPIAYVRVLLGVQMCIRAFGGAGAGAWDDLARAWVGAYPLSAASSETRSLLEASLPLLPRIADLCLLAPVRGLGGRPLTALIDPQRVRPDALAKLAREAGPALYTSPHWLRQEALRMLALSSYRAATEPERSEELAKQYEDWMLRLGAPVAAAA